MSCGVGLRRGSDPALLRLWHRPAAEAQIPPLAWEPPYAASPALKEKKKFFFFGPFRAAPVADGGPQARG